MDVADHLFRALSYLLVCEILISLLIHCLFPLLACCIWNGNVLRQCCMTTPWLAEWRHIGQTWQQMMTRQTEGRHNLVKGFDNIWKRHYPQWIDELNTNLKWVLHNANDSRSWRASNASMPATKSSETRPKLNNIQFPIPLLPSPCYHYKQLHTIVTFYLCCTLNSNANNCVETGKLHYLTLVTIFFSSLSISYFRAALFYCSIAQCTRFCNIRSVYMVLAFHSQKIMEVLLFFLDNQEVLHYLFLGRGRIWLQSGLRRMLSLSGCAWPGQDMCFPV